MINTIVSVLSIISLLFCVDVVADVTATGAGPKATSSYGLVLPTCAIECFQIAISGDGCSILDFACHCSKSTLLVSKLEPCVAQGCSITDAQAFGDALMSICSGVPGVKSSPIALSPSTTMSLRTPTSAVQTLAIASSTTSTSSAAISTTLAESTTTSLGVTTISLTSTETTLVVKTLSTLSTTSLSSKIITSTRESTQSAKETILSAQSSSVVTATLITTVSSVSSSESTTISNSEALATYTAPILTTTVTGPPVSTATYLSVSRHRNSTTVGAATKSTTTTTYHVVTGTGYTVTATGSFVVGGQTPTPSITYSNSAIRSPVGVSIYTTLLGVLLFVARMLS